MKRAIHYVLTGLFILGLLSCKKPFNAKLTGAATGILAVDGPVISGDSTFITLSRSTGLNDTTQNKPELKAAVSVEDDQATLYLLTEKGKGVYTLGITNFSTTRKYRLDIKTLDGKVYQSDFVPMKVTPPIDSIYFKQTSYSTLLFYANAHDPTNNTRYYRWDYTETYGYTSYIPESIQYLYSNGGVINQYPNYLYVGHCYATDNSNEIIVGSSAKLSNDIITGQQIGGLAADSRKISYIYTMMLHQYALTQEGFNYYQNLKSNTEQLGSIFDAQPSTITGNIHCISSPSVQVIGFVSFSTVSVKLCILHYSDIPLKVQMILANTINPAGFDYYVPPPDTAECDMNFGGSILIAPASTFSARLNMLFKTNTALAVGSIVPGAGLPYPVIITSAIYGADSSGNPIITGYRYFKQDCIDCRVLEPNATLIRPSYFPPY